MNHSSKQVQQAFRIRINVTLGRDECLDDLLRSAGVVPETTLGSFRRLSEDLAGTSEW